MIEAVQRWRMAFRRGSPALDLGQAEIARAWESALLATDLPVVMSATATPRPRLSFAAPLPPGRIAEHDLADVVLGERWTSARVRSTLESALPAGFELVDLFDVWTGAPALTAVVNAMSCRAVVRGASLAGVARAGQSLLAAASLERARAKAPGRSVDYDLRPLLLDLEVTGDAEEPTVRMLLKLTSDGPSGRPDEVVLALGEAAGRELAQLDLVRERLWTMDEAPALARQLAR